MKKERGIYELHLLDPERADRLLWGGRSETGTRRGFLRQSGLAALGAALGANIPFWRNWPTGMIPAALADEKPLVLPGKDAGLIILNDRPINAETPPHLLDDPVTPPERFFVRNNGIPPEKVDLASWTLTVDGESVRQSKRFSLADLRKSFRSYSYRLQLECAGNGRNEFYPVVTGNQWTTGAVGCAEWTGVRLRDVLAACGLKRDAVYIGYYGADTHPSKSGQVVISRGVPMAKALEEESLIAWAMGGKDIPALHGYPLRLVCGGWPGSVSGKWLNRISVRNKVHDGAKMTGLSYRLPCHPLAPGEKIDEKDFCIIQSMPVKSLITFPASGLVHRLSDPLAVRGQAWAGDLAVKELLISIDFGQTWQRCTLDKPANRLAWQSWRGRVVFPQAGYYEVWARATDSSGKTQPMVVPGWNPEGYCNNACHRIAVRAV
jgi:DMSO/TMAO reductase YedYZ molybdopterin-dependent catalytic subunit